MKKLLCAVTVLAVSTTQAEVIYVDVNCPGPGNGSELDPYCSIQTAIDNAVDTDEIVVAPGTYFETINFLGKAVWLHSSDGPEVTIIDGTGNFHVVQCVGGEGQDTVLDGFTITGGNANGNIGSEDRGGGMRNFDSSPTVTNCTFSGNSAFLAGGMWNQSSNPTVTNCTFSGNSADNGGGMFNNFSSPTVTNCTFSGNAAAGSGGGIYSLTGNPTVTNCTFSGNSADNGGGMFNGNSSPTVTNCTFSGNSASAGGGMSNQSSNPTVTNCTFSGNTSNIQGGGMYNLLSNPTVTNCTFSGNSASAGGGMFNNVSIPTVTNCILWNDSPDEFSNASTPAVAYSNIQGGFPGTGNIDADPVFVDPDNGDYRLQAGSPCIDAGNNWGVPQDTEDLDGDGDTRELTPWDLDGNPRFNADPADFDPGCGVPVVVDIGAYEFQFDPVDEVFLGDLNGDGIVGIVDFLALLANWGPCEPGCCLADLDIDGDVGIADFLLLLGNWG